MSGLAMAGPCSQDSVRRGVRSVVSARSLQRGVETHVTLDTRVHVLCRDNVCGFEAPVLLDRMFGGRRFVLFVLSARGER